MKRKNSKPSGRVTQKRRLSDRFDPPTNVGVPPPFAHLERYPTLADALNANPVIPRAHDATYINVGWLNAFTMAERFDFPPTNIYVAPNGWAATEQDGVSGVITAIQHTVSGFVTTPSVLARTYRLLAAGKSITIGQGASKVAIPSWFSDDGHLYLPLASKPLAVPSAERITLAGLVLTVLDRYITEPDDVLRSVAQTAMTLIQTPSAIDLPRICDMLASHDAVVMLNAARQVATDYGPANIKSAFAGAITVLVTGGLTQAERYSLAATWRPLLNASAFRAFATELSLFTPLTAAMHRDITLEGNVPIPRYPAHAIPAGHMVLLTKAQVLNGGQVSTILDGNTTFYCVDPLSNPVYYRSNRNGALVQRLGTLDEAKLQVVPGEIIAQLISASPVQVVAAPAPAVPVAASALAMSEF